MDYKALFDKLSELLSVKIASRHWWYQRVTSAGWRF